MILIISVLVALLSVQVSCSKDISSRVSIPKSLKADPAFHGYIVLAQFECVDSTNATKCGNWTFTVTRLATKCYTDPCSDPQEKIEFDILENYTAMTFPVFTAYDPATRLFYVAGIEAWGYFVTIVHIAEDDTAFTLQKESRFHFPALGSVFTALEFNPVSGMPLALYQDGSVFSLNTTSTVSSYAGNVLDGLPFNSSRIITQATAIDVSDGLLFANFNDGFGSEIGFAAMSLSNYSVVSTVMLGPLPNNKGAIPTVFAMNYIPGIKNLVVFGTGKLDQLIYVNPWTGNTSYAIFELDRVGPGPSFCDHPSVKADDTYKNSAYDPKEKMLYFQATVGGCTTGIANLITAGPFPDGDPPVIDYVATVAPIDFGYQGMHYVMCHPGNCPSASSNTFL